MLWAASRDSILHSLSRVSRVVKANPRSIDILQCIRVYSSGTDVYISASSAMASARVQVHGAKVSRQGYFVVDFDRFKDRVSKTSGSIVMDVDTSSLQIISSADQKMFLRLNDEREYPLIDWKDPDESYGIQRDELVKTFVQAASVTTQTSSLTPAFLQVKIKNQKIYAASGSTYHILPFKCNPQLEATIPVRSLALIVGFINATEDNDMVWVSQNNTESVVVSVGTDQFQTEPLALEFPDLSPLFEKVRIASINEIEVPRKPLIEEITRSRTSADEFDRVTLSVESGNNPVVRVCTSNRNGDSYEASVPCAWSGPDRTLVFPVDTLLGFLKVFNSDKLTFMVGDEYRGDLPPLYVKEGEQEGVCNQFRN